MREHRGRPIEEDRITAQPEESHKHVERLAQHQFARRDELRQEREAEDRNFRIQQVCSESFAEAAE